MPRKVEKNGLQHRAAEFSRRLNPRRCYDAESQDFDYDDLELQDYDLDVNSVNWERNGKPPEVDATVKNVDYAGPYEHDSIVITRLLYTELQHLLQDIEDSSTLTQYSEELKSMIEQWNNIRMNNDGLPHISSQLRWQELLRKEVALQKAQQLLCNE